LNLKWMRRRPLARSRQNATSHKLNISLVEQKSSSCMKIPAPRLDLNGANPRTLKTTSMNDFGRRWKANRCQRVTLRECTDLNLSPLRS
jgi:hypothetical protein